MKQNKSFAHPSRAFFISVHFFPVLGKSATWSRWPFLKFYREREHTAANFNFLPWLLHRTSKFSSKVVSLAFKSETNLHNDGKDWQTWTCNFERRFRYRRVVDLKLPQGGLEGLPIMLCVWTILSLFSMTWPFICYGFHRSRVANLANIPRKKAYLSPLFRSRSTGNCSVRSISLSSGEISSWSR